MACHHPQDRHDRAMRPGPPSRALLALLSGALVSMGAAPAEVAVADGSLSAPPRNAPKGSPVPSKAPTPPPPRRDSHPGASTPALGAHRSAPRGTAHAPIAAPRPNHAPSATPAPGAASHAAPHVPSAATHPSGATVQAAGQAMTQLSVGSRQVRAQRRRPASRPPRRTRPPAAPVRAAGPAAPAPAPVSATVAPLPGMVFAPGGGAALGDPAAFGAATQTALGSLRIPPFLLGIYQAAADQYAVPWPVLAAINEVETNYGRDLSLSTAGAVGWMQFMPATWAQYGQDSTGSGHADPFDAADAVFAAARYLKAAGAQQNLSGAIFSYNHSQAYVSSVLLRAKLIASYPQGLVDGLTALAVGEPPVSGGYAVRSAAAAAAPAVHRVSASPSSALAPTVPAPASAPPGRGAPASPGSGAAPTGATAAGVNQPALAWAPVSLATRVDAPVVAVRDARVVHVSVPGSGLPAAVTLRDAQGNLFSYGHLAHVGLPVAANRPRDTAPPELLGRRLVSATLAPGTRAPARRPTPGGSWATLRSGQVVNSGAVIGQVAAQGPGGLLRFAVRPAGDAGGIDPRPLLVSWELRAQTLRPQDPRARLSATTAAPVVRAAGPSNKPAPSSAAPSSSHHTPAGPQGDLGSWGSDALFFLTQRQLEREVLSDSRIAVYACGRQDIAGGRIDRRVLGVLEYLAQSGLRPAVSALTCGHNTLTTAGNVSEHSSGDAVDIAAVNGIPIVGHQGPGSITDITIRRLLALSGSFVPHQIISLMTYSEAANTLSMRDHYNHIHVGFRAQARAASPAVAARAPGAAAPAVAATAPASAATWQMQSGQWSALTLRLRALGDPALPAFPSPYSIVPGR